MSFQFLPFEILIKDTEELRNKVLDKHNGIKNLSEEKRSQIDIVTVVLEKLKSSNMPDQDKSEIVTALIKKNILSHRKSL